MQNPANVSGHLEHGFLSSPGTCEQRLLAILREFREGLKEGPRERLEVGVGHPIQ